MSQREKVRPLLCELHAHTTWSDGALSLPELVDLYGRRGFDVLCVTDHIVRSDDPWLLAAGPGRVRLVAGTYAAYVEAVEVEAERARRRYGMLVIPGAELTANDENPDVAAHALAVGLRRFVPVDGLVPALHEARAAGACLVAAHPHGGGDLDAVPSRTTRRFWREREVLSPLVDRFELFNRHTLFAWVAESGLPAVASGDFHRPEHLATWKTLLPCGKDELSVLAYLRSSRPAYLTRLEAEPRPASRIAA